ncbi:MAG: tRNA pseudouridine synthase A [Chitinophagaceae bacterium]|nr:tRNA pseudouridine(38-40) synthase TruA [Chitinophagaceae bacterium]MCZ2298012.1 tRNA pseudouridine(38-40) synthase TruA [Chitinophagales bacterium]
MPRYFLEVAYVGTNYSGFQIQQNAVTIQQKIEEALTIFFKQTIPLTGSSRTDAGVHAKQNFFHFDFRENINSKVLYNINSILPNDIAVKNIFNVPPEAHCRFNAISRTYNYYIYKNKNPFLNNRAWYYPYPIDIQLLNEAATTILTYNNFEAFSKQNTQVNNFICNIQQSFWQQESETLMYHIQANRFLRGMVRALVATMLMIGRNQITIHQFKEIIESQNASNTNFSSPAHGLYLEKVEYPENLFQ